MRLVKPFSIGFRLVCLIILVFVLLLLVYTRTPETYSEEQIIKIEDAQIRATSPGHVMDCRTWEEKEYLRKTDPPDVETEIEKLEAAAQAKKLEASNATTSAPQEPRLEHTENIRQALSKIIAKLKQVLKKRQIRMLDAQCGDFSWMPVFLQGRTDVHYTGFDWAFEKTDAAKYAYPNELWYFRQFDVVNEKIRGDYDLVFIRDASAQYNRQDSVQLFMKILASRSRYLLTATFPSLTANMENEEGMKRRNLDLFPFHFPPPICITRGSPIVEDEHFALWKVVDLVDFFTEHVHLL